MSQEKDIESGTAILLEGDISDGVYILLQGRVSVSRLDPAGQDVILAELSEGEVFGEMGLISNMPCSATVRAIGKVQVRHLNKEQFVHAMAGDFASVENVLQTLFRRMRNMNFRVMELEQQLSSQPDKQQNVSQASALAKPGTATISGLTDQARHALGDVQCFAIEKFPFRMGRWSAKKEKSSWFFSSDDNDLNIHDIPPYGISRHHCHFEKKNAGIFLVDESRIGTWIDDERLSEKAGVDKVLLGVGVHTISLGSSDSPFTFEIVVR
ncbi:MAG: cyclic nucleotide-binding domain-containing protein [Mariprofundaceae bacterium]